MWFLVGFIASFSFSQGAVIWVFISEVFPTRVRAKGQSLGSFTHWFMNAAISWTFPVVASHSRGAPFVFFAAMMVLQFSLCCSSSPRQRASHSKICKRSLESLNRRKRTTVPSAVALTQAVLAHGHSSSPRARHRYAAIPKISKASPVSTYSFSLKKRMYSHPASAIKTGRG